MYTSRFRSTNLVIIGNIQVRVKVKVRVRVGVGVSFRVRVILISYLRTATSTRRKKNWMEHDLTGNIHPDVSNYNQASRSVLAESDDNKIP